MKQCIICGAKEGDKHPRWDCEITIRTYKLPHGSINICTQGCMKLLTLHINDGATPVIWLSKDDLYEKDYNEDCLTLDEADNLTPEDIIELATDTAELLWNGSLNDTYRETLDVAIDGWRREKERKRVAETPVKELPLLIGNLNYDVSIKLLERRLKEKE